MQNSDITERPTILHVRTVSGCGGGPEKTILNSARFLESAGYKSYCLYLHPPHDPGILQIQTRARKASAQLLTIPDRGIWDFKSFKDVAVICHKLKVSIWHGHDYKSNLFGLLVSKLVPLKLVTTVHGWVQHTRRTPLYYALDRCCLRWYDTVVCVSNELYEECLSNGIHRNRCVWIANGIDTSEFRRTTPIRAPLFSRSQPLRIGAIGRLSEEKGFSFLIDAVRQLNKEGLPCRLEIVGSGHLFETLANRLNAENLHDQVALLGQLEDIRPFLETIDIFVLSSLREGLPNVLLEAMAFEVPVIATEIAGTSSLILNNRTGIIVKPESATDLKKGIEKAISEPQLMYRMAKAGRKHIESSFSFQLRMNKIMEIYQFLLKRPNTLPPLS